VLDESAKMSEYLQQKMGEVRSERDKQQRDFDMITKQPFFKRESDTNHYKRIDELEKKID
jgi:hypothetical protein